MFHKANRSYVNHFGKALALCQSLVPDSISAVPYDGSRSLRLRGGASVTGAFSGYYDFCTVIENHMICSVLLQYPMLVMIRAPI